MLHVLLAVVGCVLGALAAGEEGVLLGLLAGLSLAESLRLGTLVKTQGKALDLVLKEVGTLRAQMAEWRRRGVPERDPSEPERVATSGKAVFTLPDIDEAAVPDATVQNTTVQDNGTAEAGLAAEPLLAATSSADAAVTVNPEPQPISEPPAGSATQPQAPLQSTPIRPRPARPAKAPSQAEVLFNRFLAQTNWVTRIGLVILFFGVAFLLKFAAQHVSIPIEVRLLGVALGGAVAFVLGWRALDTRRLYGLLLQGGGIGVWYMDTYAAMRLYDVISTGAGFGLLLLISVIAAFCSVTQNAMILAVFGVLGGFLAPILASTGQGDHVMLFSYYAVLNAGIVAIVWFKAWRPLTLLGFVFTFVVGVIWGVTQYQAHLFSSTEPFLLLFWFFYVLIAVLFAWHKRWNYHAVLDGPIVFGTPAIGLVLQHALVRDFEYGMAWSTFGIGLFYAAVAALYQFRLVRQRDLLSESFWAIAVVMLSLAIPYAFDDSLTATLWALEGAGGVWLAARQQRPWAIALALLVQLGAGVSWAVDDLREVGEQLFFNSATLNGGLIALAGLFSAFVLQRRDVRLAGIAPEPLMLLWGMLWWLGVGSWQLEEHLSHRQAASGLVLFVAATALAVRLAGQRLDWERWLNCLIGFTPALFALALYGATLGNLDRPSQELGWLAWPLAFGLQVWLLDGLYARTGRRGFMGLWHGAGFLLAVALATWEISSRVHDWTHNDSWRWMALGVASTAGIWLVLKVRFWADEFDTAYRNTSAAILVAWLLINCFVCNFLTPDLAPMTYFPLFNVLDAWQILCLFTALYWWNDAEGRDSTFAAAVWSGSVFLFLNAILLRTLHRFWDIPFTADDLFGSDRVQTSLSIFWTLLGIGLMLRATRVLSRAVWSVGVALLAVVVLKLFVVDLANTGTVARIVSFMGVGVLLLAVGYFAPLPSQDDADVES